MIAPLAKLMDWSALQVAAMLPSLRKCARGDSKLTEAIEFLNGPNFIPAESRPAELEFTSNIHFTFPSTVPRDFADNNCSRTPLSSRKTLAEIPDHHFVAWRRRLFGLPVWFSAPGSGDSSRGI
jgi:hypothetical protein